MAAHIRQQTIVPTFPDRQFDVRTYGAINDGTTDNSEAFAKAIAACHEAGGGRVVVPAGRYLTGPIHLKSNVNLHLEPESRILFRSEERRGGKARRARGATER